ncbi:MAG: hypothetical protein PWQ32_767 [Thermococcaceae archaeon]|nr:hypothetical protein [Thermococcaceae archaeon]
MKKDFGKVVRLTEDAYNALDKIKKTTNNTYKKTYSYSDIVLASSFFLDTLFELNPELVEKVLDVAKELRTKKSKEGELPGKVDLLKELRNNFGTFFDDLLNNQKSDFLTEIIERLLDDGHAAAAADLIIMYKELIPEEKFSWLTYEVLKQKIEEEKRQKKFFEEHTLRENEAER